MRTQYQNPKLKVLDGSGLLDLLDPICDGEQRCWKNSNNLSERMTCEVYMRYKRAEQKPKYKGFHRIEVHKTHSQDKSERALSLSPVIPVTLTVTKELRKIRRRTVRVHHVTIRGEPSESLILI